ncbi:uncharacterized protein LOC131890600 [Tigriopus californicus]|uniref:uncharacterized protein LOC131890600 n=1 Tax=Tigriopus californicus TaxID=6832 RepID=UPI0027D9FF75|nr:uncharacterized protein LOC131890600 [Tigriopus californicus]
MAKWRFLTGRNRPPIARPVMSQIHFTGSSNCVQFQANPFKADLCQACLGKIGNHSGATPREISAALEYSVDQVPSSILPNARNGKLFVGGYKASINKTFLINNQVCLIVNTCPSLPLTMGSKYVKQLKNRNEDSSLNFRELTIDWQDSATQIISLSEITDTYKIIGDTLKTGESALIHCAQGKSRSVILAMGFLIFSGVCLSVDEALQWMKDKRQMSEPNPVFILQLKEMEKHLIAWARNKQ